MVAVVTGGEDDTVSGGTCFHASLCNCLMVHVECTTFHSRLVPEEQNLRDCFVFQRIGIVLARDLLDDNRSGILLEQLLRQGYNTF